MSTSLVSPDAGTRGSLTAADIASVPQAVIEQIRSARRVMTVCHRDPEPDALGSALGMTLIVEALGAVATPVCADPVPEAFAFLPRMDRFRRGPDPAVDYDLIVVGDCGELPRVGSVLIDNAELFARVPIVNIDHHKSNVGFGAVDWIDAGAAATCEMVTLTAAALGVPIDAYEGDLATQLMAGVVIDTANFQHPNTTARTLRVAAELVAAGAPLSDIARRLYRTKPNAQLRLFGRILGRLESGLEGRLVWSTLERADHEATASPPEYSEGIVDLLGQSSSAEVAILFKEMGPVTRLSVRTRDNGVDATVLTGRWGGGGHARAAGATLQLPVSEARPVVLAEATRLIQVLGSTE